MLELIRMRREAERRYTRLFTAVIVGCSVVIGLLGYQYTTHSEKCYDAPGEVGAWKWRNAFSWRGYGGCYLYLGNHRSV